MKFDIRSAVIPFILLAAGVSAAEPGPGAKGARAAAATNAVVDGWTELFDGQSLAGWRCTEFAGSGEVRVQTGAPLPDGVPGPKKGPALVLAEGNDMTGVNCTNAVPRMDYELRVEAMRVRGGDFFCGLTFPVGATNCSLIVGGWGGGLVGISSIDGMDASENETTSIREFENGRWYEILVRVRPKRLEAWIDGERAVDANIEGRKVSMRPGEIEMNGPLGICTWRTTGAVRSVRVRTLPPETE